MLLVLPAMMTCDSDEDNSHCPGLVIEAVFPFVPRIGCIGTKTFEVSSQAQSRIPGSPSVYFIPPRGFSFRINLPSVEFATLKNFYDESHELKIFPFREVTTFEGDEKSGAEVNPIGCTMDLKKNEV